MLPDYPGIVLSFGRHLAFGLIALLPASFDRKQTAILSKADWLIAFKLSLVGNLVYYAALASAIQLGARPARRNGCLAPPRSLADNHFHRLDAGDRPVRLVAWPDADHAGLVRHRALVPGRGPRGTNISMSLTGQPTCVASIPGDNTKYPKRDSTFPRRLNSWPFPITASP